LQAFAADEAVRFLDEYGKEIGLDVKHVEVSKLLSGILFPMQRKNLYSVLRISGKRRRGTQNDCRHDDEGKKFEP